MSSNRTKTILAAGAALGLGGAAFALSTSPANAAPQTKTFEFTGESQEFVVPADVCRVEVDVFGAEGGTASDGNIPGLGGHATATITVTPGETLQVNVGGKGGDATTGDKGGGTAGLGGFNGGGDGGVDGNADPGGGGGGASDVRQGGTELSNRVVVAGGGGGSGGDSIEDDRPTAAPEDAGAEGVPPADRGAGGQGGGTTGTAGQDSGFGSEGGGGGSQSAGGAHGSTDSTATDGSAGQGGTGGAGNEGNDGGGGGGGGYFGGGGGAGDTGQIMSPAVGDPDAEAVEGIQNTSDGGGGGGGSGFGPAGVVFETGVQSGDGVVNITYDTTAGTCGPDVAPDSTVPPVVAGQPAFTG